MTLQNDNFYHECGHLIITKLFNETLTVEFLSLDSATAKAHDPKSLGGLKGKFAIPVSELTMFDHDKAILAMLAGLCVDDLNNTNRNIDSSFYEIPVWAKKFNASRYEGDIHLVLSNFAAFKDKTTITWQEYISLTLKFLYNILNDDTMWDAINILRRNLMASQNHTLNNDQIDDILNETNFGQWVHENKMTVLDQRKTFLDN